jgi:2,3-dihydroxyphenylpropionate 1,2-dioxygenase
MGKITAALAMSHAPLMADGAESDPVPEEQLRNVVSGFTQLREELADADADLLLVVFDDHFENFFRPFMPTFAVSVSDSNFGPPEHYVEWLGIERREIPSNGEFAQALAAGCIARGHEITQVQRTDFGHAVMVPMEKLRPQFDLPIVPVFTNVFTPPTAPLWRAYELGRAIREVIDERPEKVAVLATGAFSHNPPYWLPYSRPHPFLERMKRFQTEGLRVLSEDPKLFVDFGRRETEMAQQGEPTIAPEWDRKMMDAFERGDVEWITSQTYEQVVDGGGPGGFEVINWVILLGIMNGAGARTLAYEPVVEWISGIGIMSWADAISADGGA